MAKKIIIPVAVILFTFFTVKLLGAFAPKAEKRTTPPEPVMRIQAV